MTLRMWCALAMAVAILMTSLQAQRSATVVIQAGTLIDGSGKPPQRDVKILIEGGRITAVGAAVARAGRRPRARPRRVYAAARPHRRAHAHDERASGQACARPHDGDRRRLRVCGHGQRRPHAARRLHHRTGPGRVRLRGPGDQARHRSRRHRRTAHAGRAQHHLHHRRPRGSRPTASARPSRSTASAASPTVPSRCG